MNVSIMSFFAKVSDPLIGGTYMTLLNTITNLGGVWIKTFFLWLLDIWTWKSCSFNINNSSITDEISTFNSTLIPLNNITCQSSSIENKCETCVTDIDGFFIEVGVGIVFTAFWFYFGLKSIRKLQNLPIKSWHVLSDRAELVQKSFDRYV